jgi:hypothetical protein
VIHISRPDNRFLRRSYRRCPIDECITEQVTRFELWYDATTWCTKCGESWAGGQMFPRPFQRGWRRKAQQWARTLWDRATYGDPPSLAELEAS